MQGQSHSFGPFVLSPGKELRRDGKVVPVGQRGLLLLEAMLAAEGEVVTKAEIFEKVWPGVTVEEGNITVQVAALRKELGTGPDGREWIVTVPRIGYRLVHDTPPAAPAPSVEDQGKPNLAVLPFANLSSDPNRDYFADGIVEDLITALSRFKSFSVVSRYSSFAYKGRAVDVRQVARELGVRYLLEGSVRLSGEGVRVTVQLVDAASGTHLWASSFDGQLGQIFEFQDRITVSVVGLVEPQIRRAEIERTRRRWPDNPQAYDYFLRALPYFNSRDPADYMTALGHLNRAIEIQPDYALALAYASWALARHGTVALTRLTPDSAERCLELARAALRYGDDDPVVLAICSHSLLAIGHRPVEALATIDRALQANPHNIIVLALAGICNMLRGDPVKAEEYYSRAYRLSPGAPEASESLSGVGFSRFMRKDFGGAVEWLERSRTTLVDWPPTYWILTAAYAHLDRLDEARAILDRLLTFAPHTTLAGVGTVGDRSDERFDLILTGLAKAGLT
ncbi:MAG: winged helix-turn-helix domain-containing tetratricopeptide repeat protein, partial [Devosia sp.]